MNLITEKLIEDAANKMFSGRRESEEVLDEVTDILFEKILNEETDDEINL